MISRKHNLVLRTFVVITLLVLAGSATYAQALNSTAATVSLNATLSESLTVAATPSTVTFALVSGATATGSAPVAMTTKWILSGARTSVTLVGYFTSAAAALTDGATTPTNIPTSEVLGQVTTGTPTAFTSFTQTAPLGTAGAGLTLFTQAISAVNRAATRNDNLNLQINLTSQPQLPAGTYTGTLNLQAQAL